MSWVRIFLLVLSAFSVTSTHEDKEWSFECDTWKKLRAPIDDDWKSCPKAKQSASGCGDFDRDPRSATCTEKKRFLDGCSRRFIHRMPEPDTNVDTSGTLPMNGSHVHVCYDDQIEYPVQRMALPVVAGRHREQWGKWGAYEFLPMTRWVHNIEHGTVAFLYNHCLAEEDLCKLKSYIGSLVPILSDVMGPFRWVLTPAPLNRLNSGSQDRILGIAVWGRAFLTDCWNPKDMDDFIFKHYRWTTPEDFPKPGNYSHLYLGNDTTCPGTVDFTPHKREPDEVQLTVEVGELRKEVAQLKKEMAALTGNSTLQKEVEQVKKEMASLKEEIKLQIAAAKEKQVSGGSIHSPSWFILLISLLYSYASLP